MNIERSPRWLALLAISLAALSQAGCALLAAGAAGGVIGHEISENNDDDDDE